jgi:hypothetical protein
MLALENHLFGCTRSKPSQCSVPASLTLASDFGFCFQCQALSSLVLRRPIEITRLIRHDDMGFFRQYPTSFQSAATINPTMKYSPVFNTAEMAHKIKFVVQSDSMPANDVAINGGIR